MQSPGGPATFAVMAEPATILIVDDHRAVREELAFALGYDGWRTREAGDGPAALELVRNDPEIALVLLDVKLPGLDGLEVQKQLKELRPDLPVVMISGHGDLDTAVLAVRNGAYDFLQKPFATDRVLLSLRNALANAQLRSENTRLRAALQDDFRLLGDGAAMTQVRALISKVAPTDVAVLVLPGGQVVAVHRAPSERERTLDFREVQKCERKGGRAGGKSRGPADRRRPRATP